MNKEFIPYEQALELKRLGFDESCFGFYDKYLLDSEIELKIEPNKRTNAYFIKAKANHCCLAPLYQQAFRWFREKYNMHSFIDCKWKNLGWEYVLVDLDKMETISTIKNYGFKLPEEAELACLKKLIEINKNYITPLET